MQKYWTIITLIFFTTLLSAQTGRISGTIVDSKTGETLPGATIMVEGTSRGGMADFDGKFAINSVPVGKVTVVISYISYTTKKIADVNVTAGDPVDLTIQLDPSDSKTFTEIEVVTTVNKETNTAAVLLQKNSGAVADVISAQSIKISVDRTTSDVLKRVSGVTIQDDKFVIVRGLNERYNASYLNESPLPSTESDKKAFAFDLFPSNMLDNIVVLKTATPDMPSEFAGGIVKVNTKSIPEKNFVSFSTGVGYNTITTGKQKTVYDGGKLDKFGFDDGSRDMPSEIPALKDKASWISNPDQAKMAGYFDNDWGYKQSKFNPNLSAQLAAGYNFKRKEKDFLGVIFSLGYNSTQNRYSLLRREYDGLNIAGTSSVIVQKEREYVNTVNQTQTSTGSLLNFALKLNENNSISLKNLFTATADNRFISSVGSNVLTEQVLTINRVNSRFFSANQIYSSQLNSEHFLPKSKIKIAFNAGLSNVKRTVPNMRFTSYNKFDQLVEHDSGVNPLDTVYKAEINVSTGPAYSGYRIFSRLTEDIKSSKIDISRLFKINSNVKIEGKVGGFYQDRRRQFTIRQFGLQPYETPTIQRDYDLPYLPEDQIFAPQNMGVAPSGLGGFKLVEITRPDDNYMASSQLAAAYGMAEVKYKEKIRLLGGLRYESYHQNITSDFITFDSVFVDNTVNDILPSVNLIYNINEKLGLRLAYYKTLNRPEFRELALTNWYDPETRLSISGNPLLKRCYIQNYDVRFEVFPGRGQLFTTSGFYKYFNNPIERYMFVTSESQIVYQNANFGTIYGAEMEYRVNMGAILKKDSVKFLNNLTLFANLSLMKSQVNVDGINDAVPDTRQMQGQAPYLVNAGLSYLDNVNDFSASIMVNRVGQKIYLVGNDILPNRWENARTVLDFVATKTFFKKRFEVRLNIKDILHPDWVVYYKGSDRKKNAYDKDVDYINFKRNYGTSYTFILSYKF